MKFHLITVLGLFAANFTAATEDYDYIVIGSGSAGSIVASRLAEGGEKVLVLEAGGDESDPAVSLMPNYFNVAFNTFNYGFLNWGYESVEQSYATTDVTGAKIFLPRGKVAGGTFSINAAAFVAGIKEDYDVIAETIDDCDWSWNNINIKVRRLVKDLDTVRYGDDQVGASEFIDAAADVLGYKYDDKGCLKGKLNGVCASIWAGKETSQGGLRSTSFDKYLRPLVGIGKIEMLTFHRVDALVFDDADPTKVVAVDVTNTRANLPNRFRATKEIIVSAGTYNTPQILMLSGIGPAADLQALDIPVKIDRSGVGKNLRDHFSVPTFWDPVGIPEDKPFLFQSPTLNMFGPEKEGPPTFQLEISGTFGSVASMRARSVGDVKLASNNPADKVIIAADKILGKKSTSERKNGKCKRKRNRGKW